MNRSATIKVAKKQDTNKSHDFACQEKHAAHDGCYILRYMVTKPNKIKTNSI